MTNMLQVTVYDGKYTVLQDGTGKVTALRYGKEWRDCIGDGLILALAQEVENLRERLKSVERHCEVQEAEQEKQVLFAP